ncbi:hypothetical protein [Haloferax larsenii]|uniref:Uncharacterized protein n=1 Tax=Haloferax larsenii TaxID=302484 RepID=A0A1H7I7M0_HALLR|nr:hypothetical protein [Haloferax larsenii]SEK56565.1 hypothetical protein SAMN04488691_101762 [Haloferax larsenii]
MNVIGYVGFVAVSVGIAASVRWVDPPVLSHLSRRIGLASRKGWAIALVALLWVFLPILAGAAISEALAWVFGGAVACVGFYLATVAVSSWDEYRLLERVPYVSPEEVRASGPNPLVATAGVPTPLTNEQITEFQTPFTGRPAVHTRWLIQRQETLGFRDVWRNSFEGSRSAEFELGGGVVRVTPGRHRVFNTREHTFTVDLDGHVPEPAATYLETHPELPSPGSSDDTLRIVEEYVPSDEVVTVVGSVVQSDDPEVARIDSAPVDALLGTHGDNSERADGKPEAVLIRGNPDEARTALHQRVYWLGRLGIALILVGQFVSFWFSSASLVLLVEDVVVLFVEFVSAVMDFLPLV